MQEKEKDILELDVPVACVSDDSMVGLEHTGRVSRFRLTVLEPHRVGARNIGGWSGADLGHDS